MIGFHLRHACAGVAALATLAGWLGGGPARAETVAEFYKGKTVRVVIGSGVGGSYAVYAQLMSRHLGRFLPGAPTVVMQNMPGAGGLVAMNYLGTQAPRDGSVVTIGHITIVHEGLFNPRAKFNPREFLWVGRFSSFASVGVASKKSGIRSIEDAKKREVTLGASGAMSIPGQAPAVLNKIAGTKFKIISGYKDTGASFLALERGEVEAAGTSIDALRALHWDKLKSGELIPIYVQGIRRWSEFPHAPTLLELGKTDVEKAFLNVFSITAGVGRSLATPPGVPKDRLDALRAAYDQMIVDPGFKADVEKLRLILDPLPGADLQKEIGDAMVMSEDTRQKAKAFYEDLFGTIN
jgi:tripartite-type tricarboxylate transporter receptor subunit TctC